jgi:hypothetical protein
MVIQHPITFDHLQLAYLGYTTDVLSLDQSRIPPAYHQYAEGRPDVAQREVVVGSLCQNASLARHHLDSPVASDANMSDRHDLLASPPRCLVGGIGHRGAQKTGKRHTCDRDKADALIQGAQASHASGRELVRYDRRKGAGGGRSP